MDHLNNLGRHLARLVIQNLVFRRLAIDQGNHQSNRLLITGVCSIMPFTLSVHRKEQSMTSTQNQRLLLRLRWNGDVDRPVQVHDDLGVGSIVQTVGLAGWTRDVGDVGDIGEVHVHGARVGAVQGGWHKGVSDAPAFKGRGGLVGGVDDGGCRQMLLLLGVGSQESGGKGEKSEEVEEAHFAAVIQLSGNYAVG